MKLNLKDTLLYLTLFSLLTACSNQLQKDQIMPYFPKDAVVKRLLAENKAIAAITEEDIIHILSDDVYDREDYPTSTEQWLIVPKAINEQNSHLLSAHLNTGLRDWQVSSERNNFLVLKNWETGALSVKKPSHFKRHRKQQITPLSAQGEATQ